MIAGILNGWARWVGLPAPGMTRILLGECILWAAAGFFVSVIFLKVIGLGIAILTGNIRFTVPHFIWGNISRIMQLGLGISIILGLFWFIRHPYLLLTTLFPNVSIWIGNLIGILASLLIITSFILK